MEPIENNEQIEQPVWEPVSPQEMPTDMPVDVTVEMPQEMPVDAAVEMPQDMPVAEDPFRPVVHPKRRKIWKGVLAAVLVLALVAGSCAGVAWLLTERFDASLAKQQEQWQKAMGDLEQRLEEAEKKPSAPIQQGSSTVEVSGQSPAQVYENNAEKVVLIKSQIPSSGYSAGGTSTGSGFVLTSDGYVVTNYHVVEGGNKLFVVTSDNTEYEAKLVGYDNANDVAVLKVDAENLPAVELGNSDLLTVGDQVVAIGNPLGELTSTLTVGYVSAKERDVNTSGFAINMIQTDAAINSGNSGGPLFNMAGQVVGITTAKYSGSSSSGATIEGIGFAIPINDVAKLLNDLVTKGYVSGAYLGVSVSDMDAQAADYYGMPLGAYVNEVVDDSCADRAGIKVKDIITAVEAQSVESVNDLSRALRNYEPGDTVELTLFRGGAEHKIKVTLDEKPKEEQQSGLTELPQQEQDNGWGGLFPGIG